MELSLNAENIFALVIVKHTCYLRGYVNKHNGRYSTDENPHIFGEGYT